MLRIRALFILVPVSSLFATQAMAQVNCGPEGSVSPSVSYIARDTGVDFRQAVLTLIGQVPDAGSSLKAVTGFLWKEEGSEASDVFAQMKDYVDQLVPELIAQERARDLEKRLAGLHQILKDYNGTSYGVAQKGQWFTSLLALLNQAEPFFFDPRNPEKTLPYFVPMGTLRILALQEQYLYYQRIYAVADPDRNKHLTDLQNAIKNYTDGLNKANADALRWRTEDKISFSTRKEQHFGVLGPTTTTIWSATDHLCSWQVSFQNNSASGSEMYGEQKTKVFLAQRRAQVTAAYGADLDLLMAPAYLWRYMDPTNPGQPESKPVYVTSGPFGSSRNESGFDDNPDGKPITRIVVYAGTRVDGLEVFYGDRSGGLHGKRSSQVHAMDLGPGEIVASARGRAGDAMDALFFQTSGGRDVGGGGRGGNEWYAAPPQGTGAGLYKASGRQGQAHLAALNLTWSYVRFPPQPTLAKPKGTFTRTNESVADFQNWTAVSGAQAVVGDFAGTGRSSIALVGGAGWGTVPVAFSNGDGTFAVTNKTVADYSKWAAGRGVKAVAGHFDDSGRDAIALIGDFPNEALMIPVAFSNGDGTFNVTRKPLPNFPGSAAGASAKMVVGHFDDSGQDSVALVGFRTLAGAASYIPVALSKGDGNFAYTPKIPQQPDQEQMTRAFNELVASPGATVLAGDFDGNGRTAIALVGGVNWTTVPVAHPTGDGGFIITNVPLPEFTGWAAQNGVKPVAGRFDRSGKDAIALVGGPGWGSIPAAFPGGNGSFTVTNQSVVSFANWGGWPGARALTGNFSGTGLTGIALTGPNGWGGVAVAFPTGSGNFNVTGERLADFPGWAAANGARPIVGDFAGNGTASIALIGGVGWQTLPVAFTSPPPPK
jgi:hypothetical protein